MKKYKNGLVLGKFYPFHMGHQYLIDTALSECDRVHVMVCSLKREAIKGIDRFLMVQNNYNANINVRVINCNDENPQYPNECETTDIFYNDFWVPTVRKHVPDLDVIFTSEEYGDEFASYLGCEHVLVDIKRETYPISGTAVRTNVFESWDLLPASTRRYFQKRVCVVGPESTGKSTLVKKLADHYKSTYVEEYGRSYVESIPTSLLEEWDFYVIAKNHARLIENASTKNKNKNMFLFIDTDAIITKTFANMYLGGDPNNKDLDRYVSTQNFDLYLFLTPEVGWVNDGTRDFPRQQDRLKHAKLIQDELIKNKYNYKTIHGKSYDDRLQMCINEIDKFTWV